jgi:pimeloyl-ACP methyl ester carboxylesterase
MRHELGLDLPERRIGLSAHDFAQLLGHEEVILTHSAKVGGAPAGQNARLALDPLDADRLFPVLARRLGKSPDLREMLAAYKGGQGGARLIRAARNLDPRQTENIGEALRASGVPALVLWGERDEFLSIDAVGQPLAELLGARLVKLPGAHFTPLDCPAEVAAELRDFLS